MTAPVDVFGGSSFGGGGGGPVSLPPERLLAFSRVLGAASGVLASTGQPPATRYRFRINPQRLNTRHDKLERYVLTGAGYERQDWGNGLSIFQFVGTSGVFRPEVTATQYALQYPRGFDIRKTVAWQKFREFETFCRTTQAGNLFMFLPDYDHEWEGSISQLSFDRDAERPFQIGYQFTFTGLPIDYPSSQVEVSVSSANDPSIQQRLAGRGTSI